MGGFDSLSEVFLNDFRLDVLFVLFALLPVSATVGAAEYALRSINRCM